MTCRGDAGQSRRQPHVPGTDSVLSAALAMPRNARHRGELNDRSAFGRGSVGSKAFPLKLPKDWTVHGGFAVPKINTEWKVVPHGSLEQLDEGLETVAGEIRMPLGNFPRRMTIVSLQGGRSAIWSAIPVDEPTMKRIQAMGRIAFLIVPNPGHRLDVRAWKARFPDARVACTSGAREGVEKVIPVEVVGDALDDPAVRMLTVPGLAEKEAALSVERQGRVTLVLNDILANVRHPRGFGAQIMARAFGFGVHGPRMPSVCRRVYVKDAKLTAAWLEQWSRNDRLARVVVSHGDVIEDDPRGALADVAKRLSSN